MWRSESIYSPWRIHPSVHSHIPRDEFHMTTTLMQGLSFNRASFFGLLVVQIVALIVGLLIFVPTPSFFSRHRDDADNASTQSSFRRLRLNRTCHLETDQKATAAIVDDDPCVGQFLTGYLEYCQRSLLPRASNVPDLGDYIRSDGNISCLCPCIPHGLGMSGKLWNRSRSYSATCILYNPSADTHTHKHNKSNSTAGAVQVEANLQKNWCSFALWKT